MQALILNSGSSNCKLSLFNVDAKQPLWLPQKPLWKASCLWQEVNEVLKEAAAAHQVEVIGHRIVHGGDVYRAPARIDSNVKKTIERYASLAPLHNPRALEGIEITEALFPKVPGIAVFDTAFHRTIPEHASIYPGPYEWSCNGIKRFGFHGISYQYVVARTAFLMGIESPHLVVCHLGNGSSCAAIQEQKSVDTTMGFTPLEGLMMGTRCGSIDPGLLLYLQQEQHISADQLYQTLHFESGLKGISGSSSDMRKILELSSIGDPRAVLSFKMYVHSVKHHIGAMAAQLRKWEALVFTGGIGENACEVRASVCEGLQHFGVVLDAEKNQSDEEDRQISTAESPIRTYVIHTEEDWCIAKTLINSQFS